MSRVFTLGTLVTRCLRRANKQGDGQFSGVSDAKSLISEIYGEMYTTVAEAGLRHFEKKATITTDGTDGSATWAIPPSDLLATIGVDQILDLSTGRRRELYPYMVQERELWSGMTSGNARVYAWVDQLLSLQPRPPTGQTYELLYIPQPADLSTSADNVTVDVICPAGEKFLVWGVAALLHGEGETDAELAVMQQGKAKDELFDWASMRLFNDPPRRIVRFDEQVMFRRDFWDDGGWWNR